MKKKELFNRKLNVVFFFAMILFTSCESFDFGIEDSTYYDYEIFSGDELDFYGKWKFVDYYGGITGVHKEPTYDYLKMKSSGVYEIYKGLKCIEKGKIVGETITSVGNGNLMTIYHFLKDGVDASDMISPGLPTQIDISTGIKRDYNEIAFEEWTKLADGEEITTVDRNKLIIYDGCYHIFKRVR